MSELNHDIDSAAEALNCSKGFIRKLARAGTFPNAWKLNGKDWRIPQSDIDQYIEQHRVSKTDQAAA